MEKVKAIINNKKYSFPKGTSLLDISKYFSNQYKLPIVVSLVDNILVELNYTIEKDCVIEFLTPLDRKGNSVYQKGLIFLLVYAVQKLYGSENKIKVAHSIDKGISIRTNFPITEDIASQIKFKMEEVVKNKIPITRCLTKRREAVSYFNKIENFTKASTYLYINDHYITLYRLDDMYDYFYSAMPINTEVFTSFDLKYIKENEFILQFPVAGEDINIPEYHHLEKVVQAFDKYYDYAKQLNIRNSSDINKTISTGRIKDIIKLDETLASNTLLEIAKNIYERKTIKIILISGPSSSGKTTTAKKLGMFLHSFGVNPKHISTDNYFLARKLTPKFPNGDYDYDSLRALDLDLFGNHLKKLLKGEEIDLPTYNFLSGEIEYKNDKLKLEENDVLIIEGLHALNEELTKDIAKELKYKLYVSALTDLNIDDYNAVSTSDLRLVRRIVRDYRTRGYTAEQTIKNFARVRDGEEQYVFPFQRDADFVYNTALIYEIGVLRLYAEPLLYEIDNTSPYYEEARRLIKFLEKFLCISTDAIPNDSLLKEFIGDSFFD